MNQTELQYLRSLENKLWTTVDKLRLTIDSSHVVAKFNEKVSVIIIYNCSLVKQGQNLKKIHNTLLPKLLSGEIELEAVGGKV